MQYFVTLLSTVLLTACLNTHSQIMNDSPISVTVQCTAHPDCLFTGDDMPVVVSIKNNQPTSIELPLAYLQKTGPIVKLIDNTSKQEVFLKKNLASHDLRKNLIEIKPGKSASIEWILMSSELLQFNSEAVDITAEFTVSTNIKTTAKDLLSEVTTSGSVKIIGKTKK
jgi:hypothetical protein